MNTLPEDIRDTIYKYKHQIEFQCVISELNESLLIGAMSNSSADIVNVCINRYVEIAGMSSNI